MTIICNPTFLSYRSTSRYGLEVNRHSLVLVHLLAERRQRAIFISVFHSNHVLVVCLIRPLVGLKNLDVVLNLILPPTVDIDKLAIQRPVRALGLKL